MLGHSQYGIDQIRRDSRRVQWPIVPCLWKFRRQYRLLGLALGLEITSGIKRGFHASDDDL